MMNPLALIEAGDIFLKDTELQQAIFCYEKALTFSLTKAQRVRIINNLGVTYKRSKMFQKAIGLLSQGIELDNTYAPFYTNLASLYQLNGEFQQALSLLLQGLNLQATEKTLLRIIELYTLLKNPKEALHYASLAIKHFPESYESHLALGNLYSEWKQFSNAIAPYQKAIQLDPKRTQAYNNIGVAYKELSEYEHARLVYEKVIELNPNDPAVYNNYGNLLKSCKETDKAIAYLEQSIRLKPNYADAYSNLGAVYKEKYEFDKAVAYYNQALKLSPKHVNAHFDLGLIALSLGHYEAGWENYQYRLKMNELLVKIYGYKTPMWQGEDLHGKSIVLQNEQGYGDNIMFIRYARYFKSLGAHVIVRTRPSLIRLFETMSDIDMLCSEDEAIPEHDYYLPLLSAPFYAKTRLDSIPQTFPYLDGKIENYDCALSKDVLHVGIVWSGSNTHKAHMERYIGLEVFQTLFELDRIVWHSLQVDNDIHEIEHYHLSDTLQDHSAHLHDFAQTASLIMQLDLVITSDTSVAHLCGALNKEAWVLVPKHADWRWMQSGSMTPWYQSLVLFRQLQRGNWQETMNTIKQTLEKKIHTTFYVNQG